MDTSTDESKQKKIEEERKGDKNLATNQNKTQAMFKPL